MPGADSAGVPWEGRRFSDNSWGADDGSAPPHLEEAIRRFHAGEASAAAVVDAVRTARLLIPLVAELGEAGANEHGRLVDKSQELSIVTVAGPDGRAVLPAFSSVDAMRVWNPTARPVPAEGTRVALAAAGEGTELVVLDPTSDTEFVIRRPALAAIALGRAWTPPVDDPALVEEFADSVRDEPDVVDVVVEAGDPAARLAGPEIVVRLALRSGLHADAVNALVERVRSRWSPLVADAVDSLGIRIESSGDAQQG